MTEAQETSTARSIVKSEYRNKYKDPAQKDWLAKLIDSECGKTKTVTVREKSADGESTITRDEQRPDGLDTGKLMQMAVNNDINIDNLKGHEADHGFPGRARMTIGNGLRRVAKQRHGVFNVGRTFLTAPADLLEKVGAADKPTHNQDGSKISVAKPAKEPAAEAEEKPAKGKKGKAKADA